MHGFVNLFLHYFVQNKIYHGIDKQYEAGKINDGVAYCNINGQIIHIQNEGGNKRNINGNRHSLIA